MHLMSNTVFIVSHCMLTSFPKSIGLKVKLLTYN